jgi:hypothetical protein
MLLLPLSLRLRLQTSRLQHHADVTSSAESCGTADRKLKLRCGGLGRSKREPAGAFAALFAALCGIPPTPSVHYDESGSCRLRQAASSQPAPGLQAHQGPWPP